MVRVDRVAEDSLGAELGLEVGTELLSVNGREVRDFLDWEFLSADEQFTLVTRAPNGDEIEFDVERPEGLPMGLELEPPRIRRCGNRCDFCFVDGLPTGLRETLYIRDDDYRLSFRHGNFATLTNLKPADVDRIIEYRLSPLYVSVHATDPIVRRRLLRNPRAPDILRQLGLFADAGIQFHTQIVLQPGLNDGQVLQTSLDDLYDLGHAVLSVSVVPVGLTEYSKHSLTREPTRDECLDAIARVHGIAERAIAEHGRRWAMGSDELYLVAEHPLPPADWYGDFDQVENGVGSVRYLQQRIARGTIPSLEDERIGVVTGTAMGQLMTQVTAALGERTGGGFEVLAAENGLFGPRVTTAGLLPGRSILDALRDRTFSRVLIPAEALNDDDLFVDDVTFAELQKMVEAPVYASYDFADVLGDWS